MTENTEITFIKDYKDSRVIQPNPFIEALKALGIIFVMFSVMFVLCFSQEILKAFG